MALGLNLDKPEQVGASLTLVTTNAGAGSLRIKGNITGSTNTPEAFYAIYDMSIPAGNYSLADSHKLATNPLAPATFDDTVPLVLDDGAAGPGPLPAPGHLAPLPASQEYVVVVWPANLDETMPANPVETFGTSVARSFWITDDQQ
jgi:hypothetical protein